MEEKKHKKSRNNYAVSPVISAMLALTIISIIVISVSINGVGLINKKWAELKADENQSFQEVLESIEILENQGGGKTVVPLIGGGDFSHESNSQVINFIYTDDPDCSIENINTCFLAGTKVLTSEFNYKNIDELTEGEEVLSYDFENNQLAPAKIVNIYSYSPDEMDGCYLVINNNLRVTPNHLFYSQGEWLKAGDLVVGDNLFTKEGSSYKIDSIKKIYDRVWVYDLEIEYYHNFYVNINNDFDVLVHNRGMLPGAGGEQGDLEGISGGTWVKPSNYYQERRLWMNPENIYDGDTNTFSSTTINEDGGVTADIQLLHDAMKCSHVKFWANTGDYNPYYASLYYDYGDPLIDWTTICENKDYTAGDWHMESIIPVTDSLLKVKIFFSGGSGQTVKLYELMLYWVLPSFETLDMQGITQDSATIKGLISDDAGADCQYNIYYDDKSEGDYEQETGWIGSYSTGQVFSHTLEDLEPGTLYRYKVKIRNGYNADELSEREVASEEQNFLTKPNDFTDFTAEVKQDSLEIILTWNNGVNGDGLYIEYLKADSLPAKWPLRTGNLLGTNGINYGETVTHSDLLPDTAYYYKAWAIAKDGEISDGSINKPFGNNDTCNAETPQMPLTITTPSFNSMWYMNETYNIKWEHNITGSLNISLYKNGQLIKTIANDINVQTGSYSWQVPTDLDESENYRIKVTSEQSQYVYDYSSEFSILEPRRNRVFSTTISAARNGDTYSFTQINDDCTVSCSMDILFEETAPSPIYATFGWYEPIHGSGKYTLTIEEDKSYSNVVVIEVYNGETDEKIATIIRTTSAVYKQTIDLNEDNLERTMTGGIIFSNSKTNTEILELFDIFWNSESDYLSLNIGLYYSDSPFSLSGSGALKINLDKDGTNIFSSPIEGEKYNFAIEFVDNGYTESYAELLSNELAKYGFEESETSSNIYIQKTSAEEGISIGLGCSVTQINSR